VRSQLNPSILSSAVLQQEEVQCCASASCRGACLRWSLPPRVASCRVRGAQPAWRRTAWLRSDINLVLVHPLIPQNTGTTARTCAATGVGLHLVGPLGFELDDRKLKRAGLDYWDFVTVQVHADWEARPGPPPLACCSFLSRRAAATVLRSGPRPRRRTSSVRPGAAGLCGILARAAAAAAPGRLQQEGRLALRGARCAAAALRCGLLARHSAARPNAGRCATCACAAGAYKPGDWLLFGAETTGLPPEARALAPPALCRAALAAFCDSGAVLAEPALGALTCMRRRMRAACAHAMRPVWPAGRGAAGRRWQPARRAGACGGYPSTSAMCARST